MDIRFEIKIPCFLSSVHEGFGYFGCIYCTMVYKQSNKPRHNISHNELRNAKIILTRLDSSDFTVLHL